MNSKGNIEYIIKMNEIKVVSNSEKNKNSKKERSIEVNEEINQKNYDQKKEFNINFDKFKEHKKNKNYEKLINVGCPIGQNLLKQSTQKLCKVVADCDYNLSILIPDEYVRKFVEKLIKSREKIIDHIEGRKKDIQDSHINVSSTEVNDEGDKDEIK